MCTFTDLSEKTQEERQCTPNAAKTESIKVQTLGELRMRGTAKLIGRGYKVFTRCLPPVAHGESDRG